eukprot:UN04321
MVAGKASSSVTWLLSMKYAKSIQKAAVSPYLGRTLSSEPYFFFFLNRHKFIYCRYNFQKVLTSLRVTNRI